MGIVAPVQMSWRWPWHDKVWYRCCILEGKLYPGNFCRLGSFNDYDEYDVWLCAGFPSGRGGLSDEALLRLPFFFSAIIKEVVVIGSDVVRAIFMNFPHLWLIFLGRRYGPLWRSGYLVPQPAAVCGPPKSGPRCIAAVTLPSWSGEFMTDHDKSDILM